MKSLINIDANISNKILEKNEKFRNESILIKVEIQQIFLNSKFEEPKRKLVKGNIVLRKLPIKEHTNIKKKKNRK